MKLTEKAKVLFEKWYNKNIPKEEDGWTNFQRNSRLLEFYSLADPMKYGVYVDFFDSVGIYIEVYFYCFNTGMQWKYSIAENYNDSEHITRTQAREKAIERANEILNKQL